MRRMGSPSPGVWAPLGSVTPAQGTLHIVLSSQTSESDILGEKVSDFKYTYNPQTDSSPQTAGVFPRESCSPCSFANILIINIPPNAASGQRLNVK